MRGYKLFVLSGLLVGLTTNFSGNTSHTSDLKLSDLSNQAIPAHVESGADTTPHRGSGR